MKMTLCRVGVLLSLLFTFEAHALDHLSSYVNTLNPGGNIFVGANAPFGHLMWGPVEGGFSLTSLSGAEMNPGYWHDFPVLPSSLAPAQAVSAGLKMIDQSGSPGFFEAKLQDGSQIDLSSTQRAGIAQMTFPAQSTPSILIDLDSGDNHFERLDSTHFRAYVTRYSRRLYLALEFSQSVSQIGQWDRHAGTKVSAQASGIDGGVYFTFPHGTTSVSMKVSLSSVRPENAELNLKTEIADWDFARIRALTQAAWDKRLSSIEIEGASEADLKVFYTLLFHTFMQPNVFSDVNGEYMGFDFKIHRAKNYVHYSSFSGWDIYRSWVPLMALLAPEEVSDMMQSLVNDASQGGGVMPRWVDDNFETGVMNSGSATPIVTGAYAFGARGFDVQSAYAAMDRVESQPGAHCQTWEEREYLGDYLKLGYMPYSNRDESDWSGREGASYTLEVAMADFALSQLAAKLGKTDRAAFFLKLSDHWRNTFNPATGYFEPRLRDGTWWSGFDDLNGAERGYTEGNAHQYIWMVPHDLGGLFETLGGDEKVNARLDQFFTQVNAGLSPGDLDGGSNSPYSWIGNEPSFEVPFEYNWSHAAYKTQALVHRVIREAFMSGMPGADDLGAMSAWGVWAFLGLYPEIPGVSGLTVSSPFFPQAILHFGQTGSLTIHANPEAGEYIGEYIQSAQLNGVSFDRAWIETEGLWNQTSTLDFNLGTQPTTWGSKLGSEPPSFESR